MKSLVNRKSFLQTMKKILENRRVVLFGDPITDEFIEINNVKISPEVPILTLDVPLQCTTYSGGVNNVRSHLIRLSARCDTFPKHLVNVSKKYRYMKDGQYVLRIDSDCHNSINWKERQKEILPFINNADNIVIQDYGKGAVNNDLFTEIIYSQKSDFMKLGLNITVIFNPHITTELDSAECDVCKINSKEFLKFSKSGDYNEIIDRFGVKRFIIVTHQTHCDIYDVKRKIEANIYNLIHDEIRCPNIVGCGDIITAILGKIDWNKIDCISDLENILKIAMGLATLKCEEPYLGYLPALIHKFQNEYVFDHLWYENYLDSLEYLKIEKLLYNKIIFINGCFDILHPGHFLLLEKAQNLKNLLNDNSIVVIAINSDESIFNRKKRKPLIPICDRMYQLCKFANHIIPFNTESQLEEIIKICEPDFMIKGEEYKKKKITGKKYCEEIIFVPKYKNYSSTLLRKI